MKQRPSDWEQFDDDSLREAGVAFDALPDGRSRCVPLELLRAARVQALPEDAQAKVATHLASCSACRHLDADLEAAVLPDMTVTEGQRIFARAQSPANAPKAQGARVGWRFSWQPALATLAVAAVVFLAVRTVIAPAPPPSPPSVVVPPRLTASVFELQKAPVKLSISALIRRSDEGAKQQGYRKDFGAALDAYRADDFALAAQRLESLSARFPRSTEVSFYLGVSRLFLKNHAGAIEALKIASGSTDDALSTDIAWYYALALQRTGRIVDARSVLTPVCSGKSEYAARACAGIRELTSPQAGTAR